MKNFCINLFTASKIVLNDKLYFVGFLIITAVLFWLFLYIPVRIIPGNDFTFQLSILSPKDITVLVLLSLVSALSLTLHLYMLRKRTLNKEVALTLGSGFLGGTARVWFNFYSRQLRCLCHDTVEFFGCWNSVFPSYLPAVYYYSFASSYACFFAFYSSESFRNM